MPEEIELKLETDDNGLSALLASDLFADSKTQRLHAIYFDTPDQALRKAGLSLRIRRAGRRRIQTVKASAAPVAGLFARQEWEMPVRDDSPVVDGETPLAALPRALRDRLAPAFTVTVQRNTALLSGVELSVDRGTVLAGDRRKPVREIELELKSGDAAGIFQLARRIAAIAPVRLGTMTKSESGYRLLDKPPVAFKSEPVGLRAGTTTAQAWQPIGLACLRHYRLNEDLLLSGRHPEALHQARVALRRLRSALSIFRPVLPPGSADPLKEGLRDLAAVLGQARDLDVLAARAGNLAARLQAPRDAAYDRVAEALESDRTRSLMLDLAEWLAVGDWQTAPDTAKACARPVEDFAAAVLSRLRRRLRKDGADLAKATDEARHETRKDAKKLRYAVEFFGQLYEGKKALRRHRRFLGALEKLQDRLGVLNDLATTPALLRELGLDDAPEARPLLAAGKRRPLIRSAARAHDALSDAPKFWS